MDTSGLFSCNNYISNIICQYPALFPNAGEEVNHTGDGIAVGGEAIAQHEAVEAPAQRNAKEPAEADAQHHAVQQRQCHTQLRITDALDEGTTATHEGQRGEHPQDRLNEHTRHLVNCGVIGEDAEQSFTEQQVGRNADSGQSEGKYPCPVDGLDGSPLLPRRAVLADHGQGGILDALRNLVDDVIDADAHTKGSGSNYADIVDHGIDK